MAVSERRGLGRGSPAEWGQRLLLVLLLGGCSGRIHQLALTGEKRADIQLNSFGFYTNGSLEVELSVLRLGLREAEEKSLLVGFSLSRVRSGRVRSYSTRDFQDCPLQKNSSSFLVLFLINTKDLQVQVRKYGEQKTLFIFPGLLPEAPSKPGLPKPQATVPRKVDGGGTSAASKPKSTPAVIQGPSGKDKDLVLGLSHLNNSYNFSFHVVIGSQAEEGQYSLNFHNCNNSVPGKEHPFDITVMIREKNPDGFLSAAEMPLFKLYMVMSACFLAAGIFWVSILCRNTYSVFKIHWLMAALAFTKSISLLFHSINYYFINSQGHPIEGLAVMYYIAHLLKGALLFITIALIGSGWAFIKYVLSDKEKKVFGIVIPMQVLANVAYIIIESREEGASDYVLWKEILFLVDLICCGAILFPVVWSIRHLQDASGTDGKVAVNLAKLKLFRHYYVMVICYVYFTRIIAILLQVAVPFQWQWLYQLLVEGSTLAFFVLTGYKFQPTGNNPYLQLPQEDEEDVQMEQVMTDSGFREGLSKVNKTASGRELL
ncbi:protein GPR108 isoform 1 precursor [Homo sapiens]|uniref:Protein GPR108 n=1 Tax=Homo sapiens TaxID=9606 RepID=GP108_HUMAN|nr:protein GPR108 isoform 1 precursor [Homo sapiens]Q9NPR9.3 RecName: Full=Protein GPR108; AltName: Full=Lung seven transmembrane receptor 2; Flags: Precursor [Homo sapiens]|eukprot:NP_001073921.1 protein GPR108 isoform 1 precursor [Homo sapiens]